MKIHPVYQLDSTYVYMQMSFKKVNTILYPCVGCYLICYLIFQNIKQGQILEGFDPQVPGSGVKTTYNEEKISISVKTDQRSSKSDKKLGSVGQNSPTPNLEFS